MTGNGRKTQRVQNVGPSEFRGKSLEVRQAAPAP